MRTPGAMILNKSDGTLCPMARKHNSITEANVDELESCAVVIRIPRWSEKSHATRIAKSRSRSLGGRPRPFGCSTKRRYRNISVSSSSPRKKSGNRFLSERSVESATFRSFNCSLLNRKYGLITRPSTLALERSHAKRPREAAFRPVGLGVVRRSYRRLTEKIIPFASKIHAAVVETRPEFIPADAGLLRVPGVL